MATSRTLTRGWSMLRGFLDILMEAPRFLTLRTAITHVLRQVAATQTQGKEGPSMFLRHHPQRTISPGSLDPIARNPLCKCRLLRQPEHMLHFLLGLLFPRGSTTSTTKERCPTMRQSRIPARRHSVRRQARLGPVCTEVLTLLWSKITCMLALSMPLRRPTAMLLRAHGAVPTLSPHHHNRNASPGHPRTTTLPRQATILPRPKTKLTPIIHCMPTTQWWRTCRTSPRRFALSLAFC